MVMDMENQLYTTLNNGKRMPLLGLGTYNMFGAVAVNAVSTALETGYRLIDGAQMYGNEKEVGEGIRRSGIPREEIFITTKIDNCNQGYDETLRSYAQSLKDLQVDKVDLLLIHWPIKGKREATWKAIEQLYADKQVGAIGTGNYLLPFLHELTEYSSITPAVNQIEFSPFLNLKEELDYCNRNQICLQCYTPLMRGNKHDDPRIVQLAQRYSRTPAQIILRWAVQQGLSTIPKSENPARIKENFNIFNFEIDAPDLDTLNNLNEQFRIVDNPIDML
jgi:diketogulonate reductase-like aldo/keto reductase